MKSLSASPANKLTIPAGVVTLNRPNLHISVTLSIYFYHGHICIEFIKAASVTGFNVSVVFVLCAVQSCW